MRSEATRIIVGHDVAVAEWVRQRLERVHDWGPCQAIGVARGDELITGIVYNNLIWPSIEASIASTDPGWCSRRNLAAIFAYPFRQLGCRRLGALTEATNQPVRAFLCRLGFREEGLCRQALPSGDAVIYGMTPEECRWLGETRHVERRQGG
jgi:RimJ/RimL family protein N-acetyltransferase